MTYFLGVDGGQSSTTALIGDASGSVVGSGRGGPCNHVRGHGGREKFVAAISTSLDAACAEVGLPWRTTEFRAACFGLSGGPSDKQELLREMVQTQEMLVTHDGLIALSGATAGGPGIAMSAGTGSIAVGRNASGEMVRVGGWGYIYGDEGSGFDITREALRAALRAEEGWGPATALRAMLLEKTGTADANELLHLWYTTESTRPQIAALSKQVDAIAKTGDAVAIAILEREAEHLATFAGAVRDQLFSSDEMVQTAYIGGVFRSRILLEHFRDLLSTRNHVVTAPRYGPAAGALIEAYRLAGIGPELCNAPKEKT